MKLFSFRKPLSFNMKNGTYVVNDLARNYKYVEVCHPQLGNILMYQTFLAPGAKAYYTIQGKFILLEKTFVGSCEETEDLVSRGKFERSFFMQRYLPNGDYYESRRTYLTDGIVCDQLTERRFTLQIGTQTYVQKVSLVNGVWQKQGKLPATAISCWKNALRAYCLR